jgi:hypothetical protein
LASLELGEKSEVTKSERRGSHFNNEIVIITIVSCTGIVLPGRAFNPFPYHFFTVGKG